MQRRGGFTLIELLITITVMVILLTLGVINLRGSQAAARDEKRKADAESIARGLEQRYNNGNPKATASYVGMGSYPSVNEIRHAQGVSIAGFTPAQVVDGYLTDLLPGTSRENFIPPNNGTFSAICTSSCQPAETSSVIDSATTIGKYVYEPITSANAICINTECVRFNLYYRTEVNNTVQKIVSKNQ